jgi:hypothetical protein
MKCVVIARYRARTGEEGRVEEALRKMVEPTAHRGSEHFGTWLSGQVLPALAERTRLDLVPID